MEMPDADCVALKNATKKKHDDIINHAATLLSETLVSG